MSQYFPKPHETFWGDIDVKVYLSHYATKSDVKNATGINTSLLPVKYGFVSLKVEANKLDIDKLKSVPANLSNLKSKVDKLDFGKLETIPVDLSKLSNVVKMMFLKYWILNIMLRSKILKIKYLILLT